tara:strand:+ start:340 stop:1155 length:816 start_codon:yes stop_codon:yes gene_type:complete
MDFLKYRGALSHLFCLMASVLLLGGCSGSKTLNPQQYSEKSLNKFFSVIGSSGLREAYYLTHPVFQSNTPFRTLLELDAVYGLKNNQGVELSSMTLDSKKIVSVEGAVILSDSISVPFMTKFSKDEKSVGVNPWKMIYIEFNMKKFFENQGMVEPDSDVMLSLVKKYFLLFHGDLKRLQLSDFYDSCSRYWKTKTSLDQMEQAFQPLINNRFLTQDFRDASFVLNYQSGVRDTGILVTAGNIVGSSIIEFHMEFFFESGQFRPINFNLKQL